MSITWTFECFNSIGWMCDGLFEKTCVKMQPTSWKNKKYYIDFSFCALKSKHFGKKNKFPKTRGCYKPSNIITISMNEEKMLGGVMDSSCPCSIVSIHVKKAPITKLQKQPPLENLLNLVQYVLIYAVNFKILFISIN